jgi:hypothetical protein
VFQYDPPNFLNTITSLGKDKDIRMRWEKALGFLSTYTFELLKWAGFLPNAYLTNSFNLIASSVGTAWVRHGVTMIPICVKFQYLHRNTLGVSDTKIPSITTGKPRRSMSKVLVADFREDFNSAT